MNNTGRITEELKNYYVVDTGSGTINATVKGSMRKTRPCVGDVADFVITDSGAGKGLITGIHPRNSFMARPPLANMDLCILVATVKEPEADTAALDRFLFSAAVHGFEPAVVFNKADILNDAERLAQEEYVRVYSGAGYKIIKVSAHTGENLDALELICEGRFAFLAGPSGVGKTAILSRLLPGYDFRTAPVSAHTGRGTHTTTGTRLLPLPLGGYLADTPGFSLVSVPAVSPDTVMSYFPEIARQRGKCRFNNCIHDTEPGCVVRDMVDKGDVAVFRRLHYLDIYREMDRGRKQYSQPQRSTERRKVK